MAQSKRGAKGSQRKRKAAPRSIHGNQGEGNREADRRYREGATGFARSGRAETAGHDARRSVDEEAAARGEYFEDDDDRERGRDRGDDEDPGDDRDELERERRSERDRTGLS